MRGKKETGACGLNRKKVQTEEGVGYAASGWDFNWKRQKNP